MKNEKLFVVIIGFDNMDIKFVPRETTIDEFMKDPKYDGYCISGYVRNINGQYIQKVLKMSKGSVLDYSFPHLDFDGDEIIPEIYDID